jgi:hypothetical protein
MVSPLLHLMRHHLARFARMKLVRVQKVRRLPTIKRRPPQRLSLRQRQIEDEANAR